MGTPRHSGASHDGRHAYVTGWLDSHVYMVGLKPDAASEAQVAKRETAHEGDEPKSKVEPKDSKENAEAAVVAHAAKKEARALPRTAAAKGTKGSRAHAKPL